MIDRISSPDMVTQRNLNENLTQNIFNMPKKFCYGFLRANKKGQFAIFVSLAQAGHGKWVISVDMIVYNDLIGS